MGKHIDNGFLVGVELKFNPDTDNIDEFIEQFEDLATLNNLQEDYKLHAFKNCYA